MSLLLRFRARGSSSGYDIRNIPGIALVLDADRSRPSSSPRTHGQKLDSLVDLSTQASNPTQPTVANQPSIDLVTANGAALVSFGDGQHMSVSAPSGRVRVVYAVVWVPQGAASPQILATQDTSAVTDKPAWEVQVG